MRLLLLGKKAIRDSRPCRSNFFAFAVASLFRLATRDLLPPKLFKIFPLMTVLRDDFCVIRLRPECLLVFRRVFDYSAAMTERCCSIHSRWDFQLRNLASALITSAPHIAKSRLLLSFKWPFNLSSVVLSLYLACCKSCSLITSWPCWKT